eukprot:7380985-Prymnesium_polylepis.2
MAGGRGGRRCVGGGGSCVAGGVGGRSHLSLMLVVGCLSRLAVKGRSSAHRQVTEQVFEVALSYNAPSEILTNEPRCSLERLEVGAVDRCVVWVPIAMPLQYPLQVFEIGREVLQPRVHPRNAPVHRHWIHDLADRGRGRDG